MAPGNGLDRRPSLGYNVVRNRAIHRDDQALLRKNYGECSTLIKGDMEEASVEDSSADLVLAMGSLQYTCHPAAVMSRLVSWASRGGVCVLADAYLALILELLCAGQAKEALERRKRNGACGCKAVPVLSSVPLIDRNWWIFDQRRALIYNVQGAVSKRQRSRNCRVYAGPAR